MARVAFVFPGQGSQAVGMGKELADRFPEAKAAFDEADDALGMKLSTLCFEGPEADLRRTATTQPAILTTSIAALRAFQAATGLTPGVVCGHSLGEYSALVAAGCLDLRDAVKAVHARGTFMQEAVPEGEGAMAAVLGADPATVQAVCAKVSNPAVRELVEVANYNGAEQTVIAGHKAGVDKASAELKAAGAKRVMPLPVSAPFHCALMAPVQPRLSAVLDGCRFHPLAVPCVTNVEASANQDHARAKALLIDQVVKPVRFTECAAALVGMGVDTVVELGPGKVLTGIVKRLARTARLGSVEDLKSLEVTRAMLAP